MGNYLLVIAMSIVAMNLFGFSLKLNEANRVIVSTPKSIFESSINVYSSSENPILTFNTSLIKEKLTSYYDTAFEKHNIRYSLMVAQYRGENSSANNGVGNGVKVVVMIGTILDCKVSRTITYEIRNGAYGK